MTGKCRERRFIERHFAGRTDPADEQIMRRHLPACDSCSHYYDRHAVLASVDPQSLPVQERLGAGLGFAMRRSGGPHLRFWTLAPVTAALVLALVAGLRRPNADDGFTARSAGRPQSPALLAYRVAPGGVTPLGRTMGRSEELAFAYENPAGYHRLMVVAVDDRGKLYWFHPDPDASEAAVAIAGGAGRRELPEAILHQYADGPLHILGLFSNRPIKVSEVTALLDRSGCRGLRPHLSGVACAELNVIVKQPSPP
jgi:hypothetical protein